MSNEEPTLPPVRQPNTLRTWLPRIWAWACAHPDVAIGLSLVVAAFFLGRCTAG